MILLIALLACTAGDTTPGTDGGSSDGGSSDGGSSDGGSSDGGSSDGGSTDGGSTDGGDTDGGATTDDTGEPDSGTADGGTEEEEPVVTEEVIPDTVLDDAWIFSHDTIHTVEISLPAESVAALTAAPSEWAEASFSIDGLELDTVGMRLRGKIGSFRDLNGKPKIKIDFDQYIEDQRFYGLKSLSLNNSVVDCGYLKEVVGYEVFEQAGVPHSRTGWARVQINGADYGLYQVVEVPDDVFLERNYPDPSGNLYDGKYVWYGGYSYTLLDFASGVDELYQLEEGTDVGWSDIHEISDMHSALRTNPSWYARMGELVDWPALHRMWAVEQWVGHVDGYCMNRNNYRVYFDPTDGKAEMIPWDLDYAFLHDWSWGMNWAYPTGTLAYYCFTDEECWTEHQAVVSEVLDAIDTDALLELTRDQAALIAVDAASDPRRECSFVYVGSYQDAVRSWVYGRTEAMRTFWGL